MTDSLHHPWEGRRPGELTTVYLGRVLEDYLGEGDMARRARQGHFDDYFAPAEIADGFELIRMVKELVGIARWKTGPARQRYRDVIAAVKDGEFDGTPEESARWEASADGQAALSDPAAVAAAKEIIERAKEPGAIERATAAVDKFTGDA